MRAEADVEQAVLALVKSVLPPGRARRKTVTPETNLRRELGLDSLRLVAMVVGFEARLGVDLAKAGDIDFTGIQTVGDVIAVGQDIVRRCEAADGR